MYTNIDFKPQKFRIDDNSKPNVLFEKNIELNLQSIHNYLK